MGPRLDLIKLGGSDRPTQRIATLPPGGDRIDRLGEENRACQSETRRILVDRILKFEPGAPGIDQNPRIYFPPPLISAPSLGAIECDRIQAACTNMCNRYQHRTQAGRYRTRAGRCRALFRRLAIRPRSTYLDQGVPKCARRSPSRRTYFGRIHSDLIFRQFGRSRAPIRPPQRGNVYSKTDTFKGHRLLELLEITLFSP